MGDIKVRPDTITTVSSDVYPWINRHEAEVNTVGLTLEDGTQVQYGSIIGLNGAITSIAEKVPEHDAKCAQSTMLNGLAYVLKGEYFQGISRAENSRLEGATLFVASSNLRRVASLVFAIERADEEVPATILRVGSAQPNALVKLLRITGANPVGGKRRRK